MNIFKLPSFLKRGASKPKRNRATPQRRRKEVTLKKEWVSPF